MFTRDVPSSQRNNLRGSETYAITEMSTTSQILLYSLSSLRHKVHQAQSLVSVALSQQQIHEQSLSTAQSSIGCIVQEIVMDASSIMPVFQQLASDALALSSQYVAVSNVEDEVQGAIIQLEAADLLAKYTHFCEICSKGFKRGANLRMHMRAHGDEYKTNSALQNPFKYGNSKRKYYYSCPNEGCKWNKKHKKFKPLKSLVCAKNHYRRSHCPKMYVCKRCESKQFAVLSDLRTHEKNCGDAGVKWPCSCGSTFSRKDKLLGHAALFATNHTPVLR